MQPVINARVYIVDDDASVRDAFAWLLRSRRLYSEVFESAQALKQHFESEKGTPTEQPSCMLLDVRMPGMSGLELFDWLIERQLHLAMPVIFLTGHADVPTAVDAVKRGAFDFCEKPYSDNALVDRVEHALAQSKAFLQVRWNAAKVLARRSELSERERDVMRLVMEGLPNKLIADRLDISIRTVEVHRSRVFDKMEVKSAVELANLLRDKTV
jgi:two-component system response regulator DctR